jgi:Carboxypeptidase regulatory-like domain/TonB-dependent Receptor Plug Domain
LGISAVASLFGQTTQGLISGSIMDSVTGRPIMGASVTYSSETLAATGTLQSDAGGYYFLPLLSAGTYTLRTTANGYQSQELDQLELPVAGRIQIDFKLRPLSDVWEAGQFKSVFLPGSKTIVTFYGPDVDTSRSGTFEGQQGTRGTLDTSVSYVIDPEQIEDLPLQGRDVYTMLVSLPEVTADNGTARGIGVSVAGARPSSSNYLLDGVSNNNYLITGPLSPVAPEMVQEYRISTNNYSAEYGQTAGFVANAVTKAGGNAFHGLAYDYIKNTVFNAADFADNLSGAGRLPVKEQQFGYQVGGPILKSRLFFSSALEQLISHSNQSPVTYELPSANFIPAFGLPSTSLARQLLETYPGPVLNTKSLTGFYTVAQPVVVDRLIALERGDYTTRGGRDHLMARLAIQRLSEPDFIWSPYPAFISALKENTTAIAGNWMHTWTPRITSELKLNYSDDDLWWNRSHPEIPTLVAGDPITGLQITLPGSPAFYAYKNLNRTLQGIYSTVWTRNRHIISAGAGVLFRFNQGYLTAGQGGEYLFSNIVNFAFDDPQYLSAGIDRTALQTSATPVQPDYNRTYFYPQTYLFAQDSYRVSSRLTLNFGIRYDNFGAPANTGAAKDALVQLGPGADFNARLASAALVQPASGHQQIFGADNGDFAGRFGFSWDPFGKSKTVLRGGYGIFYDAPFDNLWQNVRSNDVGLALYSVPPGGFNYLAPISTVLQGYANQSPNLNSSGIPLTLIDPNLRNGYAQDSFLGVQQSIGGNLTFELNGTAALGRRLITTDIVNREYTTTDAAAQGRPNGSLPNVAWRSSQGDSDYTALSAIAKYKWRTLFVQAAYTWSHAIDNQSDPLQGDFFNLDFTAITNATSTALRSSFAQQYNSNGDRGNSDFDQRQNLFLLGTWRSDGRRLLTRGWQISWMAAFRTGFPYTVISPVPTGAAVLGYGQIVNQRANLTNAGAAMLPSPVAGTGGVYLLNPAAFAEPTVPGVVGNTGRNEFRGPGLYNLDFSLGRSFGVPRLRESTRITIRADAFNILNHANLNNPISLVGAPDFGLATYGRQGTASGFPAVSPVNETARQVQMLLRLEF